MTNPEYWETWQELLKEYGSEGYLAIEYNEALLDSFSRGTLYRDNPIRVTGKYLGDI